MACAEEQLARRQSECLGEERGPELRERKAEGKWLRTRPISHTFGSHGTWRGAEKLLLNLTAWHTVSSGNHKAEAAP